MPRPAPRPNRRAGRVRGRFDHGEPIGKIDTRPMVFVALFVAILFLIAASQTRTHALLVDLPYHVGESMPDDGPAGVVHRIRVTETDGLMFDGELVTQAELMDRLQATVREPQEPRIAFEPDANASYNLAAHTLALIQRTGFINSLFCLDGLEKHRDFGKGGGAGAPFPVLFSIVPPDPRTEPPPMSTKFDSCVPEQLVDNAWMF